MKFETSNLKKSLIYWSHSPFKKRLHALSMHQLSIGMWGRVPRHHMATISFCSYLATASSTPEIFFVYVYCGVLFGHSNIMSWWFTPFENAQRWMGKNTLPILLLNDDNMIGELKETRIEMPNMCPFEKKEKEVFLDYQLYFSGTKKFCPRNNFCSVFYVL